MSEQAMVWISLVVVAASFILGADPLSGRALPGDGPRSAAGQRVRFGSPTTSNSLRPLLFAMLIGVATLTSPFISVLIIAIFWSIRRSRARWRVRRFASRVSASLPVVLQEAARHMRVGTSASLAFSQALVPADEELSALALQARAALARGEPLVEAMRLWHREVSAVVGASVLDELLPALSLGNHVGGLTASAIESIADLASEREAILGEQRAQASQARSSALVMTIAPLVFCAQMVLRDPAASRLLLRTPVGWLLVGVGIGLDVVAWWWIRRLTAGRPAARQRRQGRIRLRSSVALLASLPALVVGRVFGAQPRVLPSNAGETATIVREHAGVVTSVGLIVERALDAHQRVRPGATRVVEALFGPASLERTRRLGLAVIVLPALWLLRPGLGLLATAVVIVGPRASARVEQRRLATTRRHEVAAVVDLVRLAIESGATPTLALIGVAHHAKPGLRPVLVGLGDDLRQGVPVDEALRRTVAEAPELRPLADVLVAGSRLGLSVGETLRGLAVEARSARRREAEAQARRLPVVLLFPVVCLTLPAFVVLTVVPLLLTGLGALSF